MAENTNPAVNPAKTESGARKRISMSIPQRRLEVPPIVGYHLHWFSDVNVPRAIQAGYEFVDSKEVPVNQLGVATDRGISGNADLGSHVKVIGGVGEDGKPGYLTLMKIKEEWWQEDQRTLEKRNADTLAAIFRNEPILPSGARPEDQKNTYLDRERTLLNRGRRK